MVLKSVKLVYQTAELFFRATQQRYQEAVTWLNSIAQISHPVVGRTNTWFEFRPHARPSVNPGYTPLSAVFDEQ